jgi:D-xylose transport system ATP-binding protein
MTRETLIGPMVGRDIGDLFPRVRGAVGPVLLKVSGLCVEDRDDEPRLRLHDVDFEVRAGEVLGIGGLMGAGRTELLMHLFAGWGRRGAGEVLLDGSPLGEGGPGAAIARGLMLVSEDRKRYGLVLDQSVGFNLSLASLRHRLTRAGFVDEPAEVRRGGEVMEALRIKAPGLESTVRGLSGGNQQKVVLGKALLTDPRVILLDEPTRGIDVGAKQEVYGLINQLTAAGKAVVLVSSELPELLGMSDRILILSRGRVGGHFRHGEATQETLLQAAMAGA